MKKNKKCPVEPNSFTYKENYKQTPHVYFLIFCFN